MCHEALQCTFLIHFKNTGLEIKDLHPPVLARKKGVTYLPWKTQQGTA